MPLQTAQSGLMEAIDNAGPHQLAAMLAMGVHGELEPIAAGYGKEIQQRNAIDVELAACRREMGRLRLMMVYMDRLHPEAINQQMILEDGSRNPDLLEAAR